MGKVVSAVTGGIGDVITGIASAATDVATTAGQIVALGAAFAPENAQVGLTSFVAEDQQDIGSLIKSTMVSALAASQKNFASTYPSDTGVRSDNGLVTNYCGTGAGAQPGDQAVTEAVEQLKATLASNFTNWQFPVEDSMLSNMARTLVLEVFTKAGAGSTSFGTYSISTNQSIDWALSYGLFVVTESPSNSALIYAFSAASNSGF